MKLGVFLMPQQPRSDDPVRRFRECLEQTRLARDAGFDAVAAGHHYVSPPYQALQNLPLLARLAGETGSMDLVLSIVLLALLNPVQVAEDVATLDIMSEGRVVFWGIERPSTRPSAWHGLTAYPGCSRHWSS